MMKSCRNCLHSRHQGNHQVTLYCPQTKRTVAPAPSNVETNRTIDALLRTIANDCAHYQPEGEK